MKAGIVTHYDVHNHGAHLQLYALCKQLSKLGYNAQALRYKKNYDFLAAGADNKYSISVKSIPTYLRYLLKNGFARTLFNYRKRACLADFREKNHLVGEYYSRVSRLDAVVIGSDEIFSIEPGLNPCFWGMGVPANKTVSYAASFGPTTMEFIENHNAAAFIKAGIENIHEISVRDKNSHDIIKKYSGKSVPIVCDPVLLYDFTEELAAVSTNAKHKYCIVYSYDNNMNDSETVNAIKLYAAKRGLKVYSMGYYHRWCDKNVQADPLKLMAWFRDAEMIFTDTFHGSVISLVLEKQFMTRVNTNGNKLGYLLEQFGVEERRVNSFLEAEKVTLNPVNYGEINESVSQIRNVSLDYLTKALMADYTQ